MPFYMETYIRDSFIRLQCPLEVKRFIEDNESYSVSGNDSKGEGGDFILEAKNRRTKMWIPAGVPDEEKWLSVCRNIDRMEKVRENMMKEVGMAEEDSNYQYCYDISKEISSFRQLIRHSGYLSDPFTTKDHKSFSGKVLDDELINFDATSKSNQQQYIAHSVERDLRDRKKFQPIFMFPSDRDKYFDISNKTKAEIYEVTVKKLQTLPSSGKMEMKWKKIKSKSKTVLLEFFKELESMDCDDDC